MQQLRGSCAQPGTCRRGCKETPELNQAPSSEPGLPGLQPFTHHAHTVQACAPNLAQPGMHAVAERQLCAARYLQKGLGLATEDKPIVACVTRLVPQKVCTAIRI